MSGPHPVARLLREPAWRVAACLCAFVLGAGLLLPNYLGARLLPDLCADAAIPGIAAVGAAFVLASGSIDLSTGSLAACSSLVVALSAQAGAPPLVAASLGLASGLLSGLSLGWFLRLSRVPAFVASLGAMFALRALALSLAEESIAIDEREFAAWSGASLELAGGRWRPAAALFLVVVVVGHWLLSRWRVAREALVAGGDEHAARQAGLDPGGSRLWMHVVSGACGGLAGVALALSSSSGSSIGGVALELDAIACAVVGGASLSGGRASVLGAALAALFFAALARALQFAGLSEAGLGRLCAAAFFLGFLLLDHLLARRRA